MFVLVTPLLDLEELQKCSFERALCAEPFDADVLVAGGSGLRPAVHGLPTSPIAWGPTPRIQL